MVGVKAKVGLGLRDQMEGYPRIQRQKKDLERSKNGQCATSRIKYQVRFSPRLDELVPALGVRIEWSQTLR